MKTTVHTEVIDGFPLLIPNITTAADGFYISYNNYDVDIYGSDTTTLVQGNEEHFYILNGDHREEYSALISKGFEECLNYFKQNIDKISKYGEKI